MKWFVKLSTGGGPYPPAYVKVEGPDDSCEADVVEAYNKRLRGTGGYFVAVSAVVVQD